MTSIQVADETFVAADPVLAPSVVADPARWRRWWPDLRLQVTEDRGPQGIRWTVSGAVTGTAEFWLRPVLDGFVLSWFLHGEPVENLPDDHRRRVARLTEVTRRFRVAGRAAASEVKHTLENGRAAGDPAVTSAGDVGTSTRMGS
ncbi:hypothetical protein [Williamsia sterculiae]|uniref:Polyketide cyclase / dehydrase and lipid transport n=1 Tax=Williamsia sterculiae TaxID=1344003 RepID=A0A1N7H7B7_9NOCA|nr:hypothetical protein [Williamsia sterculiae]SIS20764.1 hypothetical protein SAMN05445060_3663 [Williamsia sterculiae]